MRADVWRVRLHWRAAVASVAVGATRLAACAAASVVAAQRTAAASIAAASVRGRLWLRLLRVGGQQVRQEQDRSEVRAHVWRVRLHWRSAGASISVTASRLAICAATSHVAAQPVAAAAIATASLRGRKRADLVRGEAVQVHQGQHTGQVRADVRRL